MYQYLGEQANQFLSMLKKTINDDNQIDLYAINNDHGSFQGYKVDNDEKEGYAYYLPEGSLFEFASSDVCTVDKITTQTIKKPNNISYSQFVEGLFSQRNEETQTVTPLDITFLNAKMNTQTNRAYNASLEGKDGFVFSTKIQHPIFQSKDTTVYNFVDSNSVSIKAELTEEKLLTNEEKKEKALYVKTARFETIKEYFEEQKISFNDFPKVNDYLNDISTQLFVDKAFTNTRSFIKMHKIKPDVGDSSFGKYIVLLAKEKKHQEELVFKQHFTEKHGFHINTEIKDNNLVINVINAEEKNISSFTAHDVFARAEHDIKIPDPEDFGATHVEELEYVFLNDEEPTEVTIIENGAKVELEDSSFNKLFTIFYNKAFINNDDLIGVKELEIDNMDLNLAHVDLNDYSETAIFTQEELRQDPEMVGQLKKSAKGTLKSSKKRTI
jgi:hypothetical protein